MSSRLLGTFENSFHNMLRNRVFIKASRSTSVDATGSTQKTMFRYSGKVSEFHHEQSQVASCSTPLKDHCLPGVGLRTCIERMQRRAGTAGDEGESGEDACYVHGG